MIQRIQTLYLFISSILTVVFAFVDIATVNSSSGTYVQTALGFEDMTQHLVFSTWAVFILVILTALLPFIAIFLYRKRILQMRLTIFSTVLTLAIVILSLWYVYRFNDQSFSHYRPTLFMSFPVISLILNYLAVRNIAIDDRLVKSLDRLR